MVCATFPSYFLNTISIIWAFKSGNIDWKWAIAISKFSTFPLLSVILTIFVVYGQTSYMAGENWADSLVTDEK
jgi:hypothetical protein